MILEEFVQCVTTEGLEGIGFMVEYTIDISEFGGIWWPDLSDITSYLEEGCQGFNIAVTASMREQFPISTPEGTLERGRIAFLQCYIEVMRVRTDV